MPDVIKLLEADHREVAELFEKAADINGAAKAQVVAKIASELTLHTQVEESIVYPAMRQAGLNDLVDEAEKEHRKVKKLVATLKGLDGATSAVDATLAELHADVTHHVEEEQNEAFPKFRKAVDQSTLDSLGDQVETAKSDAKKNK